MIDYQNVDVHRTHCCERHGCKYNKLCPVVDGVIDAAIPCEQCEDSKVDPIMEELYKHRVWRDSRWTVDYDDVKLVLEKHL